MDWLSGNSKQQIMLLNRDLSRIVDPKRESSTIADGELNSKVTENAPGPSAAQHQSLSPSEAHINNKGNAGEDSAESEADVTDRNDTASAPEPNVISGLRHNVPGSGVFSMEQLMGLFQKLDNRIVPRPESFDSSSGQSFHDFLEIFEEYCQNTFRGSSRLWVAELGRLLTGDMLSAFNTLRVTGDTYGTVKAKLLQWRQDSAEVRASNIKSAFSRCAIKPGEQLRLYAARCEKAFRLAYPNRNVESSKTLRDKYKSSIPKSHQKELATARSLGLTMTGDDLTWSNILSLASRWDADRDSESADEIQVWNTNLPLFNDKTDAITQSYPGKCSCGVYTASSQLNRRKSFNGQRPQVSTGVATNRQIPLRSRFLRSASLPRQGGSNRPNGDTSLPVESRTCHYCKRKGHIRVNCRRLHGLCLVCGANDHTIKDCSKRRIFHGDSRKHGKTLAPSKNLSLGQSPSSSYAGPNAVMQDNYGHHYHPSSSNSSPAPQGSASGRTLNK